MLICHNTFSFISPKKLWMKSLIPFSKCQKRLVTEADIFDLRIRYENEKWWVCHGRVLYASLDYILIYILRWGLSKGGIRILLENQKNSPYQELDRYLKTKYPELHFWEGRDKKTWEKLLDFPDLTPPPDQYVGSMQSWVGKICPWLWWILKGKKHQEKYLEKSETENISLDFI